MEKNQSSASTLREQLHGIFSQAASRCDEFDERGAIPEDIFHALELTGIFQALTPTELGGLALSLGAVNEILIEAARTSGSLGWVMMVHIQQSLAIGSFPRESVLRLLKEHPHLRIRGAAAPKGIAIPVEGGFVISGTWPFASGGPSPHVVGANCIVMENGSPRVSADGVPEMILAWIPADQVEFLDTWHVLGLRGTDSCDFRIEDVFVPSEMTSDLFRSENWFDTPLARLPLRVALSPGHSAVAIGIAQGAMDEIVQLSRTKRASMNPRERLADDPLFRHSIGESALRLSACRAMLEKWTDELEERCWNKTALTPYEIMMGRAMTGHITSECKTIVDSAYTLAGSTSVYNSCPLEKRLRDIHVTGQHISTFKQIYRTLGAAVLEEEISPFELIY